MDEDELANKEKPKANPFLWLTTYSDMITLMLCFFVILTADPVETNDRVRLVMNAFDGLRPLTGGMTFQEGEFAHMGAQVGSLPTKKRSKHLTMILKEAQSLLREKNQNKIRQVSFDPERGLVISLACDAFFEPDSADIKLDETRETLQQLVGFLNEQSLMKQTFRIEGHTHASIPDPARWASNWELSSARAINTLHALCDYGLISDKNFQIMGLADTKPIAEGTTPEAAAMNRRIEIVMLTDGHL